MNINYIVFNLITGEAVREGICSPDDLVLQGNKDHIVIEGISGAYKYYYQNGVQEYTEVQLQAKMSRPSMYWVWSNTTMTWSDTRSTEQIREEAWAAVRAQRDQLLQESDWRVIKAVDTGEPLSESWKLYRQALRDITTQPDPFNIIWPQEPTT